MATNIHPTAIVEKGAQLDENVTVEAFAYIGPRAQIGANSVVHHHATVERRTIMGKDCHVYPYALIGGMTQDLKYAGGEPGLKIGDRCVFREFVSVHVATKDGDYTTVGDDVLLLAYSHIAHECHVGNKLVMSSHSALGGHVQVEDNVNIGWSAGVHQFCRIGYRAMVGACAKIVKDVPPCMIADGNPAGIRAINKIGLQRAGFGDEDLNLVRKIHKLLYRDGLNRSQAMAQVKAMPGVNNELVQRIVQFIESSQRGVM